MAQEPLAPANSPLSSTSSTELTRVRRWEIATAWPLFVLSIAFFVASVWLFAADDVSRELRGLLSLTVVVTWVIFIADFVIRAILSKGTTRFVARHWFEVLSLVVPYLRPFLIIAFLWRLPIFTKTANALRARYVASVAIFALLFVYTAATAVWVVERKAPGATIVNLGDAIWWGFTTITTVGYGDFVPITPWGRFFAVLLMIGGIFVIGVVSATILSLLTDQLQRAAHRVAAHHGNGTDVHILHPAHLAHPSAVPDAGSAPVHPPREVTR